MTGKKIYIIVPGRPVPKARMTRKSKWTDRAQRTLRYQEQVAWEARRQAPKIRLDSQIVATFGIYLADGKHGDLKNYVAAAEDALQYAGIIPNDRQIKEYGAGTGIYPCAEGEERLEIIIQQREV